MPTTGRKPRRCAVQPEVILLWRPRMQQAWQKRDRQPDRGPPPSKVEQPHSHPQTKGRGEQQNPEREPDRPEKSGQSDTPKPKPPEPEAKPDADRSPEGPENGDSSAGSGLPPATGRPSVACRKIRPNSGPIRSWRRSASDSGRDSSGKDNSISARMPRWTRTGKVPGKSRRLSSLLLRCARAKATLRFCEKLRNYRGSTSVEVCEPHNSGFNEKSSNLADVAAGVIPHERVTVSVEIMKTLSAVVFFLGLLLSLAFPVIGIFCSIPRNTGCVVLFGFGIAYAGFCGLANPSIRTPAKPLLDLAFPAAAGSPSPRYRYRMTVSRPTAARGVSAGITDVYVHRPCDG